MTECAGCHRKAEYGVWTGSYWQPHCEFHMKEAIDCKEGALVRGLDQFDHSNKIQRESSGSDGHDESRRNDCSS